MLFKTGLVVRVGKISNAEYVTSNFLIKDIWEIHAYNCNYMGLQKTARIEKVGITNYVYVSNKKVQYCHSFAITVCT